MVFVPCFNFHNAGVVIGRLTLPRLFRAGYTRCMCNIRNMFVLLLCLVIPLQGVAAVVVAASCPMATQMVVEEVVTVHDCRGDVDPMTKSDKSCKSGHECPCGGHCLFFPLALLHSFAPVTADHVSQLDPTIFAFTPAAVWRPPIHL